MRSRDDFFKSFKTFSETCRVKVMPQPMEEKMILNTLRTKSVRMKQLEKFFKNIFNHVGFVIHILIQIKTNIFRIKVITGLDL